MSIAEAKEEKYYSLIWICILWEVYVIGINEVFGYSDQLVTNESESAYVDSNRESKEECKIDRHPSLSTRSPW